MGNTSTIPERNQEAALYPQELTSALLIQMPSQVHLIGNTSHNYQSLQQFLSICKFSLTIFYLLLCIIDHRVPYQVLIGTDTTHPQAMCLLVDSSLD